MVTSQAIAHDEHVAMLLSLLMLLLPGLFGPVPELADVSAVHSRIICADPIRSIRKLQTVQASLRGSHSVECRHLLARSCFRRPLILAASDIILLLSSLFTKESAMQERQRRPLGLTRLRVESWSGCGMARDICSIAVYLKSSVCKP